MGNDGAQEAGEFLVGGGSDGVAGRGGHEVFDGFDKADAAAGAAGGAVERGGGAGEVELARQGPALQQTVDEAGVEDVAGSGGVDDGDAIGGAEVEMAAVPGEDAVFAEGGGGDGAAEAAFHGAEGLLEVAFAGEAAGKSRLTMR